MKRIEPDADRYGSLVRASFFADYLELLALHGSKARLEQLRDLIGELFSRKREILFNPARDDELPDWEVTDLADEAWTCLLQRKDVLGSDYPFDVGVRSLTLRPGIDIEESPYVGVLAITLAHAFDSTHTNKVEYLFEELVADAMENAGLTVGRVGPISREQGLNFVDTMAAVGLELGIAIDANATVRRKNANDEDVDLIGHFDWRVNRKGRWFFICQATCAKSDEWRKKAQEPAPDDWKLFLGEVTPPTAFLAVPHHAEDLALKYVSSIRRNILDRPQIVKNMSTVSASLKSVIRTVMEADYQSLQV
ncbi:hypothetical protein [Microterricola pindariensis]|uniref:hypothetical protein n=1 Tax=Microterricola pindariensis TaxID=478010 RepID=UPI00105722B2|nr:hypothetical protein [Microterricola pindariensis]